MATIATPESKRRRASRPRIRPPWMGMALTAPAFLMVVAFVIIPLVMGFYIGLTDWSLLGGTPEFVGLDNYRALPEDAAFMKAAGFTLLYTALVTVPVFVVGYLQAMFVRGNRRGSVLFRTCYFLPYVIGIVAASFILALELHPSFGAVNKVGKALGVSDGDTQWLLDENLALAAIIVMVVWYGSGLTMVLLIGGMQAIPGDLYEAAQLDGASRWQREFQVTIPLLRRTIAMSLILSVILSLLSFAQFQIVTGGGPGNETVTVVMYIWRKAFQAQRVGLATAAAVVLIVVVAVISAVQMLGIREERVKA